MSARGIFVGENPVGKVAVMPCPRVTEYYFGKSSA
jgi:hypothetical protein